MAEKWVEIRLGGYLKEFGKVHRFLVHTPAEAIRALTSQIPALKRAFETAESKGYEFAVFNGTRNVGNPDELKLGAKDVVRIVPVFMGSKKAGLLQTIVGVVLIVVGVIFEQPWLIQMGIGLALGGAVQMLAPSPKGLSSKENDDSRSYSFGSPVNTSAQGKPVPLFYGKREVGGPIISAGMTSEDQT